MKLTQQELAGIRERERAATPGPWAHDRFQTDIMFVFGPNTEMVMSRTAEGFAMIRGSGAGLPMDDNGEFIANSRADIPALLDHITALEAELAEARKDSELLRDLIDADDSGGDLLAERVWDEPYGKSGNVQAEVKAMLRSAIDKARSKP
jgi:hypothetical protein